MAKNLLSVANYAEGIRKGNRVILGQAITLVESTRPEHRALARELVNLLLASGVVPQDTLRIGITGSPGAGKSTLIEALGRQLTDAGRKVAVLAVDPSSQLSKGSILGDKTRMEHLSASELAFIRPSPSGGSLGGVARATRESILLLEAAGYHTVFVETVGVGQSETAVHSMTDLFLLLLLPGAGDELQGIKRGIVEMADLLVVNKADGDRIPLANQAKAHYLNATHLLPPKESGWSPTVLSGSATTGAGMEDLWKTIESFRAHVLANGHFYKNRHQQTAYWLKEALLDGLQQAFYSSSSVQQALAELEPQVLNSRISPFAAADEILEAFLGRGDRRK